MYQRQKPCKEFLHYIPPPSLIPSFFLIPPSVSPSIKLKTLTCRGEGGAWSDPAVLGALGARSGAWPSFSFPSPLFVNDIAIKETWGRYQFQIWISHYSGCRVRARGDALVFMIVWRRIVILVINMMVCRWLGLACDDQKVSLTPLPWSQSSS